MDVTIPEMIDKIYGMVLSGRRIKVHEIVEATGISQGTVFLILHEKLGVKKSRQDGCRICSQRRINAIVRSTLRLFLALFRRNTDEFLRGYITADET